MSDLISFIFPSENYVEWTFFSIIIILFGLGWLAAYRRNNYSSKDDLEVTSIDRFIKILPAVFLSLGLLGTFTGIGLAIVKLKALSGDSTGVDAVLNQLGLKFKCSVWGIVASVLFRAVLSYYGFDDRLNRIKTKKQTDAESSNYRQLTGLFDKSVESLAAIRQTTNDIYYSTSNLEKSIITISNSAERMEIASKKLADSTEKFGNTVDDFETKVQTVMRNATEVLVTSGDNLQKSTNNMTQKLTQTFTDFSSGINATLLKIENSMAGITQDIKTSQLKSTEQITNATTKLNTSVNNLTLTTSEQSKNMNEALKLLNTYLSGLEMAAEALTIKTAQQEDILENLRKSTEKMAGIFGNQFISELERSEKITELLEKISNKLEALSADNKDKTDGTGDNYTAIN